MNNAHIRATTTVALFIAKACATLGTYTRFGTSCLAITGVKDTDPVVRTSRIQTTCVDMGKVVPYGGILTVSRTVLAHRDEPLAGN